MTCRRRASSIAEQLPGLSFRCQLQRAVDGTAQRPTRPAETNAAAAQVAEEVFTLARVVRTFGTERREGERYRSWLKRLTHLSVRQATAYLMCRPNPPPCLRSSSPYSRFRRCPSMRHHLVCIRGRLQLAFWNIRIQLLTPHRCAFGVWSG